MEALARVADKRTWQEFMGAARDASRDIDVEGEGTTLSPLPRGALAFLDERAPITGQDDVRRVLGGAEGLSARFEAELSHLDSLRREVAGGLAQVRPRARRGAARSIFASAWTTVSATDPAFVAFGLSEVERAQEEAAAIAGRGGVEGLFEERTLLLIHEGVVAGQRGASGGLWRSGDAKLREASGAEVPSPAALAKDVRLESVYALNLARTLHDRSEAHPIAIAARLEDALLAVRPFEGGNGRTVKVLCGAYLESQGYAGARPRMDAGDWAFSRDAYVRQARQSLGDGEESFGVSLLAETRLLRDLSRTAGRRGPSASRGPDLEVEAL